MSLSRYNCCTSLWIQSSNELHFSLWKKQKKKKNLEKPAMSFSNWIVFITMNETMNTYEMAQSRSKKANFCAMHRLFFRCHKPKGSISFVVDAAKRQRKATTIWLKNVWEMKLFSDGACHWKKSITNECYKNTYLDKFKWDATKPTMQHSEIAYNILRCEEIHNDLNIPYLPWVCRCSCCFFFYVELLKSL